MVKSKSRTVSSFISREGTEGFTEAPSPIAAQDSLGHRVSPKDHQLDSKKRTPLN